MTFDTPAYTPARLPTLHRAQRTYSLAVYSTETRRLVYGEVASALGLPLLDAKTLLSALSWATTGARLHRRVASAVYRSTGRNLPDEAQQRIAEAAAPERRLTVDFDITDTFDWCPGDYADEGSCLWTTWVHGRAETLPRLGAVAVRLYDHSTGEGTGRFWAIPVPPPLTRKRRSDPLEYVTCNYLGSATPALARALMLHVLTATHGGHWQALPLDHGLLNVDSFYVNPSRPWLFTRSRVNRVRRPVHIGREWIDGSTLPLPEWGRAALEDAPPRCVVCRDEIETGDLRQFQGGNYCSYCYGEVFTTCDLCGETFAFHERTIAIDADDKATFEVCPECRTYHILRCFGCRSEYVKSLPEGAHFAYRLMGETIERHPFDGTTVVLCEDCEDRLGTYTLRAMAENDAAIRRSRGE